MIETATELLKKANQEANEVRIKLTTLTACYNNLANGLHTLLKVKNDTDHDTVSYRNCSNVLCKVNYDILVKLGLE